MVPIRSLSVNRMIRLQQWVEFLNGNAFQDAIGERAWFTAPGHYPESFFAKAVPEPPAMTSRGASGAVLVRR